MLYVDEFLKEADLSREQVTDFERAKTFYLEYLIEEKKVRVTISALNLAKSIISLPMTMQHLVISKLLERVPRPGNTVELVSRETGKMVQSARITRVRATGGSYDEELLISR